MPPGPRRREARRRLVALAILIGTAGCSNVSFKTPDALVFLDSSGAAAFGNVDIGQKSTMNLQLRNESLGTIEISQLQISNASFSVTGLGPLPIALASGATLTIPVQFAPMSVGAETAQMTVSSTAAAGAAAMGLSGTGVLVIPPVSNLTCAAASLSGSGSDACTVMMGSAVPVPVSVNLSSSNSAVAVPASVTLAANATSAEFTASVGPVNSTETATLAATASGVTKTFGLTLNPTATLSGFACTSRTLMGASTDNCSVTLSAPAPTGGFTVGLSSSNPAVTVPASLTVPAGATSKAFTATAAAVSTAQTATLTASAAGATGTFGLQLSASTQLLGINATSLAFGDVLLNTPSTQTVTLTSTGTLAVTVSSVGLSGAGFTLAEPQFPASLNPGQSASFNVEFDPLATGAAQGTLTVVSTSAAQPVTTVALSGTGVSVAVDLDWDAPGDSSDPVVGYNVYRATADNSAYQRVNSAPNPQTTYVDTNVQGGTTYQYYVTSVDPAGTESIPSNTATVVIP